MDVVLDPATQGQPLTLEVQRAPGSADNVTVEVLASLDPSAGEGRPLVPIPLGRPHTLRTTDPDDKLSYLIPASDTGDVNRLSLIITRVDAEQRRDPEGVYTINMR